ncbi:MAG: hypothetical protein AAFO07_11940, partial [Bacteroidota bacterium]
DLEVRFGQFNAVGSSFEILTPESNFIIGLTGSFIFGTDVRTDVLANLRTTEGLIYGNDRNVADIQLRQRGFYIGGTLGKIFSLSKVNPRSGIKALLGVGLLQHKIRIQDDPNTSVPQLSTDNKKGYDRLTNGLAITQFLGYQYLSTDGRINFYLGLEAMQGFTASRRDFNFDTMSQDTENRLDASIGVKVGWILPFYMGKKAAQIYY